MRGFLTGWGIRIAIIAAIAVGAFIFRDRISGNAGDLAVGDCFDEPVGATLIEDVQHHPCNEAHNSEVIFVGNMSGSDDAYPSEDEVTAFTEATCVPAFANYTGRDLDTDIETTIGWFYPTDEGWKDGDREMTCYAVRVDGAPVTTSIKKAP